VFATQVMNESGAVVLPPDDASVVVLVSTPRRDVQVELPPAAEAGGRFIAVRRLDSDRRVTVVARPGEQVIGVAAGGLTLREASQAIRLVSDGATWIVVR
jgi:hypothetical protein